MVLALLDCLHSHGQEFGPPETSPEKHGRVAPALISLARAKDWVPGLRAFCEGRKPGMAET